MIETEEALSIAVISRPNLRNDELTVTVEIDNKSYSESVIVPTSFWYCRFLRRAADSLLTELSNAYYEKN